MHESFLHYVWQLQYFDKQALFTTEGEPVVVFHPGTINHHSGPDFANARIRIGEIDWVGSVEIHLQSSGWLEHKHDEDRAYDNVVLHVVWKHDKDIARVDGSLLPTITLRGRVDESLIRTYRQLVTSALTIPCGRSLEGVPAVTKLSMLERSLLQRLQRKAEEVLTVFESNGNDWQETFYQLLARSFGFNTNGEPFLQLARSLPYRIILKQAGQLTHVEALMFGQAGFLDLPKGDEYYQQLRREHSLLSQKYTLQQKKMSRSQWRFMRMRPANFPTLRLAQLAGVLHRGKMLFSDVMDCETASSLHDLLSATSSPYWTQHYHFARKTSSHAPTLGKSSIDLIITNTVAPFWAAYSRHIDEPRFLEKAVNILQQLPAEENKVTTRWKDVGIVSANAYDSQALLELFNNFCRMKSCLDCNIGASLVRPTCSSTF